MEQINNNVFLGNELQFEEDPFISGAGPLQRDDRFFQELYEDSSMFGSDVYAEDDGTEPDELGNFQLDDPAYYTLGSSAGFDLGDAFHQFDFDQDNGVEHLEPMVLPLVPEVDEPKIDTLPPPPEPTVVVAKKEEATQKKNVLPAKKLPKPKPAFVKPEPVLAPAPASASAPKPKPAPKASSKKQKTLYPVKISRVIPQNVRPALSKRSSPYTLGPPKMITAIETENRPNQPEPTMLANIPLVADPAADGKKMKPSSLIPRDYASNHIRCKQCQSSFTSQLALEFHEVERHATTFAFECVICNKIYADIREANKHITTEHEKETVPLLDSSIFGNGDITEKGKKGSQRRISGMIWSFLSNHLAQSGKLTGTVEDHETVKKEARALFHPAKDVEMQAQNSNLFKEATERMGETASINDLLKQQYIYGPSIKRIPLNSVPSSQVIRKRYVDVKTIGPSPLLNVHLDNKSKPQVIQVRPAPIVQQPVFVQARQPQLLQKATFVQSRGPGTSGTTHFLGNVYLSKSAQGTYVLSETPTIKRATIRPNFVAKKMIKVEMPPLLEHFAARDHINIGNKSSSSHQ